MQIARTNYTKDSGSNTPRGQIAKSSEFLEAELPQTLSASGFVGTLLGAVEAIVEDAGDVADELLRSKPVAKRNLLELISEKQDQERKGKLDKVKMGISETIEKLKNKRSENEAPINAGAEIPLVETETVMIPLSLGTNLKEVNNIILGMQRAIRKFALSSHDELSAADDEDELGRATISDRILFDLKKSEHTLLKWSPDRRAKQDQSSSGSDLVERIENQLSRIPVKLIPDTLSEGGVPTDHQAPVVRKSVLKNIAAALGIPKGESLNSSSFSASEPSIAVHVDPLVNDNISPNQSQTFLGVLANNLTTPSEYLSYEDAGTSPSPFVAALVSSNVSVQRTTPPLVDGILQPEKSRQPENVQPLESALMEQVAPLMEDELFEVVATAPAKADAHVTPRGDSPGMDDARSSSRSPVRRATRRAGNYTIKLASPVKIIPADLRHHSDNAH